MQSMDWLGVPLRSKQVVSGVIAIQSYDQNVRITERHQEILSVIATQVSSAIERFLAEREIQKFKLGIDRSDSAVFITDPEGADVWVEGVKLGMTPLQATYMWPKDKESRRVEFKLDGFYPEIREITKSTAILAVQLQDATDMLAEKERKGDQVKTKSRVVIPRWPW